MEMDFQSTESQQRLSQRSSQPAKSRATSSLRLKYEAETEVIKRKLGDLEGIRSRLGLSQRKIAQLLLVDPSAWTRWTKSGEDAPPHIYRMLQWYLALEDKYPALDVSFWLNTVARVTTPNSQTQAALAAAELRMGDLEDRLYQTTLELNKLRNEMSERARLARRSIAWTIVCATALAAAVGVFALFAAA